MDQITRKRILKHYYDNREHYAQVARSLNQVRPVLSIHMLVKSIPLCLLVWDTKQKRFIQIKTPTGTLENPIYETIEL